MLDRRGVGRRFHTRRTAGHVSVVASQIALALADGDVHFDAFSTAFANATDTHPAAELSLGASLPHRNDGARRILEDREPAVISHRYVFHDHGGTEFLRSLRRRGEIVDRDVR